MRKKAIMYGMLAAIILTSLLAVVIPAHAFDKDGPRPIPGNLFPHQGKPVPPETVPFGSSYDEIK